MDELRAALEAGARKLFDVDTDVELTRPEERFGDYASNAALQLAKQLGKNPREVAEALAGELKNLALLAEPPQVAGPANQMPGAEPSRKDCQRARCRRSSRHWNPIWSRKARLTWKRPCATAIAT